MVPSAKSFLEEVRARRADKPRPDPAFGPDPRPPRLSTIPGVMASASMSTVKETASVLKRYRTPYRARSPACRGPTIARGASAGGRAGAESCRRGQWSGRGVRKVGAGVAVRDGCPQCRCGPDTDRAGGEVDGVWVLQPAGIALQPAFCAQCRQVGGVEVTEQIVDRVQDRGGMRLDRDTVGVTEGVERQRDHDVDHRG